MEIIEIARKLSFTRVSDDQIDWWVVAESGNRLRDIERGEDAFDETVRVVPREQLATVLSVIMGAMKVSGRHKSIEQGFASRLASEMQLKGLDYADRSKPVSRPKKLPFLVRLPLCLAGLVALTWMGTAVFGGYAGLFIALVGFVIMMIYG